MCWALIETFRAANSARAESWAACPDMFYAWRGHNTGSDCSHTRDRESPFFWILHIPAASSKGFHFTSQNMFVFISFGLRRPPRPPCWLIQVLSCGAQRQPSCWTLTRRRDQVTCQSCGFCVSDRRSAANHLFGPRMWPLNPPFLGVTCTLVLWLS